jgi:predicted ATPase
VRPVELILARHPLRAVWHELTASRRASEIALDHLDVGAVGEYLERRFGQRRFSAAAAKRLHDLTDGSPLFVVSVIDDLLARGVIAESDGEWRIASDLGHELAETPETLRLQIERRLERLDAEDRKLLEAASLAGTEFSAAAAGAGAGIAAEEADERCQRIASAGSFLRDAGTAEWPDGTVAGCYAFRHALYRDTLDKLAPPRRRAEAHLRIGRALEAAYGGRAGDLAVALAVHFEEGGDRARAIRYRRMAAETAGRRHALVEAETHLECAVALLAALPESRERDEEELRLQSALGAVRSATRGYAAPEVVAAYTRALELASSTRDEPATFPVLWGLWTFHLVRGDLHRALELAQRCHAVAEASGDAMLRLVGHVPLWTTHFFRGELALALGHLDAGEPPDDFPGERHSALVYGQDQKVLALAQRSIVLWHLGRIDGALDLSRKAVEHARALGHPMSIALSLSYAMWLHIVRREPDACLAQADAMIAYATEQGLPHWLPAALHGRGWALAAKGDLDGGVAEMRRGLELLAQMGENLGRGPRMVDLAATKLRAGRLAEARGLIQQARSLMAATGERYHEPELYRTDAELVLAEAQAGAGKGGAIDEARDRAQTLLGEAIECARRQGSRMLELRAAAALLESCGAPEKSRARAQLAECLAAFTEGHATADLREARERLGR